MSSPPTGTVTFLFTDIESSTKLAQAHPAEWPTAKARHHELMRAAIVAHDGHVFQVIGDAFCAAFHTAPDALAAALDAQRALHTEPWGDAVVLVRMGLHTGSATARSDGDYEGYLTLVRVQRIMAGAYGGQVLLSQDVCELVHRDLPSDVSMRDLGTHRLKDLSAPEHLHQLVAPDLPADFSPLKTADLPNNLPTQLTSFIGREAEVAGARRLLGGTRLLTLMGAGGVGKTRLALKVAVDELASFSHGVWLIELAPLSDGRLIANTISSVLGVREESDRELMATLADYFRIRTALLVLDNCEHLIGDAASVCETLLQAASRLKIIATSREALGIAGEHAYRVPSLDTPADGMSATSLSQVASVQLFSERAVAANSGFNLTDANVPAVAQICRRLDGIPLALELAAARVKVFTPEQIANRLDDRFRLLTGGSRTALPRQQTLRGAVDWSFNLLDEPERALLRRLSVFAGGWTFEAAEEVCGERSTEHGEQLIVHRSLLTDDVLDLLTHLVDKSLVVVETSKEEARYRMLETVRQYAREKLLDAGESKPTRNRHLTYFSHMADEASVRYLEDKSDLALLQRFDWEIDNLRGAIDWGQESGQLLTALRMASELQQFWYTRNHCGEGIGRIRTCLAAAEAAGLLPAPSRERGRVLIRLAYLVWWVLNRPADAIMDLEEVLRIGETLGDAEIASHAHKDLGAALSRLGHYAEARTHLLAAATHGRDLKSASFVAEGLLYFADLLQLSGDWSGAEEKYTEALAISPDIHAHGYLRRRLGYLALRRGEWQAAERLFRRSLAINQEIGDRQAVVACIAAFAALASAEHQPPRAAQLLGAVEARLEAIRSPLLALDRNEREQATAGVRHILGDLQFEAECERGRAMSEDDAIAFALE